MSAKHELPLLAEIKSAVLQSCAEPWTWPRSASLPHVILRASHGWYPLNLTQGDSKHFLITNSMTELTLLSTGPLNCVWQRLLLLPPVTVSSFALSSFQPYLLGELPHEGWYCITCWRRTLDLSPCPSLISLGTDFLPGTSLVFSPSSSKTPRCMKCSPSSLHWWGWPAVGKQKRYVTPDRPSWFLFLYGSPQREESRAEQQQPG